MDLRPIRGELARPNASEPLRRYSLRDTISVGHSASIQVGLLEGESGFCKPVVFKRVLPRCTHDPVAIARLPHEASLLSQIHHPNVIQVLELIEAPGESYLVMEYVLGETLAGLTVSGRRCSIPIAVAIVRDALRGLGAAHSARGAGGQPLRIVHRNICPENLLIGVDGVTRVIDFGSALSTATPALLREAPPNVAYAPPEQLRQNPIDARADLFAAGVVLWEMLTGKRLFRNPASRDAHQNGETGRVLPPSAFNAEVPRSLDVVAFRALGWLPEQRFNTAGEFVAALESALPPAGRAEVAEYVERVAAATIRHRRTLVGTFDAPPARMTEPTTPLWSAADEDATTVFTPDHLQHPSAPAETRHSSAPPTVADFLTPPSTAVGSGPLRARVSAALSRFSSPLRHSLRPVGSTLLPGATLVVLLLAGVKLSRGTAVPATFAPPSPAVPALAALPATGQPLRPQEGHLVSPRFPETAREPTPPEPRAEPEATNPRASPPADVATAGSRRHVARRKSSTQKASVGRGSCDPPFDFDAHGVKRLKLRCL